MLGEARSDCEALGFRFALDRRLDRHGDVELMIVGLQPFSVAVPTAPRRETVGTQRKAPLALLHKSAAAAVRDP